MVEPYLFFEGRTEEALEFYKKALGAKVEMLMRHKDNPDPQPGMCPPGSENSVMHACFSVNGARIMASDGMGSGKPSFQGFSLSVDAKDGADAKKKFAALSEGGKVMMPLGKTFFAESFGMVADRFGMSWMIIAGKK